MVVFIRIFGCWLDELVSGEKIMENCIALHTFFAAELRAQKLRWRCPVAMCPDSLDLCACFALACWLNAI